MRSTRERPLELLCASYARGEGCALVTVLAVDGAAPRRVGAQLAVTAGGEYCGSLSGGCLDAAVIAEARQALQQGCSRRVRYGADSPYVDIRLPCGSGLTLQFDGAIPTGTVTAIRQRLLARREWQWHWRSPQQPPQLLDVSPTTGPDGDGSAIRQRPPLRLLVAGSGENLRALCRLARAADIEVIAWTADADLLAELAAIAVVVYPLTAGQALPALTCDAYCAAITVFHDHEWELAFLRQALAGPAFLVGAMGSRRAHAQRLQQLQALGLADAQLARLRGPLGLLQRAREPQELALSILAEVMQAYRLLCHPEEATSA